MYNTGKYIKYSLYFIMELPWWLSDKESVYQCRRHGFDP